MTVALALACSLYVAPVPLPRVDDGRMELPAAADTGITMGDFAHGLQVQDPDGTAPVMAVSQTIWWDVNQALLRFDLARLPTGRAIRRAWLRLYASEFSGRPTWVRACAVIPFDAWDERAATFDHRDAERAWSDGNAARSTLRTLASRRITRAGRWYSWDVTSIVRDWAQGRVANAGLILQADYPMASWGDLTCSPGRVGFASREGTEPTHRPVLVVELSAGQAEPPLPAAPTSPSELLRMPKPPLVVWYQCPFPEDLKHCNVDASVGTVRGAIEQNARGITSLMWSYGPNSPYADGPGYFVSQWTSQAEAGYAGTAVDEWNVPDADPKSAWCAEAMREVKRRFPEFTMAVWVTQPTPRLVELVRDGTIDLAIIEGYTHVVDHPEWAIGWDGLIRDRVELMKREGLLARTVVCVGMVAAGPDSLGRSMTREELARQVEALARDYPEMPGIGFYGITDGSPGTRELVRWADELAGRYWTKRRRVAGRPAGRPYGAAPPSACGGASGCCGAGASIRCAPWQSVQTGGVSVSFRSSHCCMTFSGGASCVAWHSRHESLTWSRS